MFDRRNSLGQQKTKLNEGNLYDRNEKTVPKLKICLGKVPRVINSEEILTVFQVDNKIENGSTTIADKVKLQKRGRGCMSKAEIFKITAQSSLPDKKRRNSRVNISPKSVSSPPEDSPPSATANLPLMPSPLPVETMSRSEYYQNQSLSSDSRTRKIPVYSFPVSLKRSYDPNSTFETLIVSNNLSPKKLKLSEHQPFLSENTNQLEVASYEEVSSVDPQHTSFLSCPPEPDRVKNPATGILQDANSTDSPEDQEKYILNTRKADFAENPLLFHDYPAPVEDYLKKDVDLLSLSQEELKILPFSVEEFFSEIKEKSVGKESPNEDVYAMVNLGENILKMQHEEMISSKVNEVIDKDNNTGVFSPKHSTRATDAQTTNSRDPVDILNKQITRSPSHHLSSKTHVKDGNNTYDNNHVLKQENYTTRVKDRRKYVGERCIVYVGNIPDDYTVFKLRKRFQKFGNIRDIQIKSKVRCSDCDPPISEKMRNYGFITFSCNQEATDAIERGNKGHDLKFHLSFGARRQFVGEEYKDLDGIVAKNENPVYKRNSGSSQNEESFDTILRNAMRARGVKPLPFTERFKS